MLHFTVTETAANGYKLNLAKTQFFFPSIVPRFLGRVEVLDGGDKLVVVQDCSDGVDKFEAYTIDLSRKRTGTVY